LKELVLDLKKHDHKQLKVLLHAMMVLLDEYIAKGKGGASRSAVFEVVAAAMASPAFALLYNRYPDGFRLVFQFCRRALAAQSGWSADDAKAGRRVLRCASVALSYSYMNGSARWTPWEDISSTSARNAAVSFQKRQFSASQLSQVLDYVTRARPGKLLLGDSQEKKDSNVPDDWIVQLVGNMTILDDSPIEEEEDAFSWPGENGSCSRSVLWFSVLNKAARQCVSSKFSAHWHNTLETFAALELALRKVAKGPTKKMSESERHQANCLLLFLFALEQELWNATRGSLLRKPHKIAVMDFSGSEPECEDLLARLRPAALQAAEALEAWSLVVFQQR
jgi:hypothetical protein